MNAKTKIGLLFDRILVTAIVLMVLRTNNKEQRE